MQYVITFIEGLISFISPCFLPMLPIYVAYFAGDTETVSSGRERKTLINALMFILGFTSVFILLGVFAGAIGSFLSGHRNILNIICGVLIIVFGLSFMDLIPLNFLKGFKGNRRNIGGAFSSYIFGVVFSVSLTPCVGAFLGSALALASNRGSVFEGAAMLLVYSLGLGVPLFISAALLSKLKSSFDFIKRHYKIINIIAGAFLVIMGILIIFGLLDAFLALFS